MKQTTREYRQGVQRPLALSATFDLYSPAGQVPGGSARIIVNFLNGSRMPGLRRYGWDDPNGFLNQDLHDQMLGAIRDQIPRMTE